MYRREIDIYRVFKHQCCWHAKWHCGVPQNTVSLAYDNCFVIPEFKFNGYKVNIFKVINQVNKYVSRNIVLFLVYFRVIIVQYELQCVFLDNGL